MLSIRFLLVLEGLNKLYSIIPLVISSPGVSSNAKEMKPLAFSPGWMPFNVKGNRFSHVWRKRLRKWNRPTTASRVMGGRGNRIDWRKPKPRETSGRRAHYALHAHAYRLEFYGLKLIRSSIWHLSGTSTLPSDTRSKSHLLGNPKSGKFFATKKATVKKFCFTRMHRKSTKIDVLL